MHVQRRKKTLSIQSNKKVKSRRIEGGHSIEPPPKAVSFREKLMGERLKSLMEEEDRMSEDDEEMETNCLTIRLTNDEMK